MSIAPLALAAAYLAAGVAARGNEMTLQGQKNIVEIAAESSDFQTLTKAIEAAGLTDTLKSGAYTVFAPTDAAFAKLPAGALDSLMANPEKLKQTLLYHVVNGRVLSNQIVKMKSAKTLEGSNLKIRVRDRKVMVDEATVIKPDIPASNGVIHAVDTVLTPAMQAKK
jgi:uncharacterized surface protein with fasciclin (FAS1) repeats